MDVADEVLAATDSGGRRLEMVKEKDGSLAITLDGKLQFDYRWPADQIERCVSIYLSLLRHRPSMPN